MSELRRTGEPGPAVSVYAPQEERTSDKLWEPRATQAQHTEVQGQNRPQMHPSLPRMCPEAASR
jgi:hypothetical protein